MNRSDLPTATAMHMNTPWSQDRAAPTWAPQARPLPRPAPRRLSVLACALAGSLGLAACVAPAPLQPMRVAPSMRLDHSGPGPAQGYVALARRYEGEGRWPEALQAWRKAALAAPGDAEVHNALGQAQAGLGDHDASVAALKHAVGLAPDQPALHNNLGYALMRAGQAQEARAALLQALALQPDYARAQANLSRLEMAQASAQATAAPAAPAAGTQAEMSAAAAATAAAAMAVREAAVAREPAAPSETAPTGARTVASMAQAPTHPSSEPLKAPQPAASTLARPPLQTAGSATQRVEIANGNGIEGMAACMAEVLRAQGAVGAARLRNALPYDTATTVVRYRAGHDAAALALARQLPGGVPTMAGMDRADSLDLRIVLGHDLRASGLCARSS